MDGKVSLKQLGSWDFQRPTLNQKETMIVQGPSEYLRQPDTEIRIACFFVPIFFRPKTPWILIPALVPARGLAVNA